MEDFKLYYSSHLKEDTAAPFREMSPETSRECQGEGLVSAMENEATFLDTNTTMLRPATSTLDDGEEQLKVVKDSDNSSVMEQSVRIEQMNLESKDPTMGKSIRSYLDESLPDLLRSGSPLRRRVSSPVSDTLKQMRREVELSRRRSIKLKAQVDKLQEQSQDGLVWSQERELVTEEIQSIVKLLMPLTDSEPREDLSRSDPLNMALSQLKNIARSLALNHTSQGIATDGTSDDAAVLQQALRDRDDALAKKKAMETELLRSKTEMMSLNNQLLEAVQRRLEMALELEAWKDDVQTIIHHQLLSQQQAEQAQKKSRGFGVLRRSKQPSPVQSPVVSRAHSPSPSVSANTPVAQRWKDRLRRGRAGQPSSVVYDHSGSPSPQDSPVSNKDDSFQTVSLD